MSAPSAHIYCLYHIGTLHKIASFGPLAMVEYDCAVLRSWPSTSWTHVVFSYVSKLVCQTTCCSNQTLNDASQTCFDASQTPPNTVQSLQTRFYSHMLASRSQKAQPHRPSQYPMGQFTKTKNLHYRPWTPLLPDNQVGFGRLGALL